MNDLASDANLLGQFLARRDFDCINSLEGLDLIVLLGSSVLETVSTVVNAYHHCAAATILVSGGIGHSTEFLRSEIRRHQDFANVELEGRTESEILRDLLLMNRVPEAAILTETRSTNCGENAWFSKELLAKLGLDAKSILLIQDPTMQRRTHATFERSWRGASHVHFYSFAPFVPTVSIRDEYFNVQPSAWSFDRFIDLILGEIPRLQDSSEGYGPSGRDFIEHVDIPTEVLSAFLRLRELSKDRNHSRTLSS